MIIIGSRALKYWYPETKEPNDYDIIGYRQELDTYVHDNYDMVRSCKLSRPGKFMIKLHGGRSIEFEINTGFGSCNQINYLSSDKYIAKYSEINLEGTVAPPEILLAIKRSHLFVPLKQWNKHIEDYHLLKSKIKSAKKIESADLIYQLRSRETQGRINVRSAKLNMTNEEFFAKSEPSINRLYVHDDLHRATCYYAQPLFSKIKLDPSKATCDQVLFEALSLEDQIRAVQEEAFSIALERKVIPAMMSGKPFNSKEALKYALFRLCTTLAGGWFRSFAQDHYYEILDCDVDYVAKFNLAVQAGKIAPKYNTPVS